MKSMHRTFCSVFLLALVCIAAHPARAASLALAIPRTKFSKVFTKTWTTQTHQSVKRTQGPTRDNRGASYSRRIYS
jgi:hypothetical protein